MKKILYVGLDVHKESIVVATAPQDDTEVELYGKIGGTLEALDKLLKKLAKPDVELRFVYEAGPCGYVIYRHLKQRQLPCEVLAPSLLPTKASDRVKTKLRHSRPLASDLPTEALNGGCLERLGRIPFTEKLLITPLQLITGNAENLLTCPSVSKDYRAQE